MSNQTPTTPTGIPAWLLRVRGVAGLVLLALALAFAAVLLYLLYSQGSVALGRPVFFWSLTLAVVSLIVGVMIVVGQDRSDPAALEAYRLQVMTWGGVAGLATALLGLALPFTADYAEVFAGGLEKWRENAWGLVWTGLAFVSGLVLLFVSLNLARGVERSSGLMRRLLYGYNVILSSVLLLLILLLINVLAYVRLRPFDVMGRTIDMTSSGIFSISDATKAQLRALTEPVHVTVLLEGNELAQEMDNLLQTMASYSPNFHYKSLDTHRNRKEIEELVQKYTLTEPLGVLVVYGSAGTDHQFIDLDQLIPDAARDPSNRAARFSFAGENALLNALRFLADGKTKPKLYVLQGHGELELDQNDPRSKDRPDVGFGVMREALEKRGFEVKALTFEGDKPEVPAEADIVVIPGPTQPIPQKQLDALLAYAQGTGREKKGKLILLGDVLADGAKFRATGIETLAASFKVNFRDERLLALEGPLGPTGQADPLLLGVGPIRIQGRTLTPGNHPISTAYYDPTNRTPFRFYNARLVEAADQNPAAPGGVVVEPILFPWVGEGIWTESDLTKNPEALAADFKKNIAEFRKVVKQTFVPVAFAVSEEGPAAGPHTRNTVPRMVVFGDATWASNFGIERLRKDHADLFVSCVNWLRDKPTVVKLADPKERKEYTLNLSSEAEFWNLALIPGALLVLATIALGLGVWVVRRR